MLVATYNIQWGKGRDGRVDLERIAGSIAGSDVVGLQEVERNWRAMQHSDEVERLAALFPDRHLFFGPSVDVDGSERRADGTIFHRRRQCGLLVLSRWPIATARTFPLPKFPIEGALNDASALLEAVIRHPQGPFRFYVTHLNYRSQRQRLLQARLVAEIIDEAPRQGGPIVAPGAPDELFGDDWMALRRDELPPMPAPAILLGDFNMRVGSPEYDLLAGPRDPDYGRNPEHGLFADALALAGMKDSEGVTYPARGHKPPKRIDHIFLGPEMAGRLRRAWIDEAAEGSDHQPVFAEIAWD